MFKNSCTNTHGSIIYKRNKPNAHQMVNQRANWYTQTRKYHTAIKGNELLVHTMTWRNGNILLR